MKRFLIVIDMQYDFVYGSLGTSEAVKILPAVEKAIREFDGEIFATLDTHYENYLETAEGKNLPVKHCIKGTKGYAVVDSVLKELEAKGYTALEKPTFGSTRLPCLLKEKAGCEEFSVKLIGLCTDICVVSNALLLKSHFPEAEISVDRAATAGVTVKTHEAAIDTMKMCQIIIENDNIGR